MLTQAKSISILTSVRVLLVDDDAEDAALTERLIHGALGGNYMVDWRDGFDSGLAAMAGSEYDVMLLDFRLTGEHGLDRLRAARERNSHSPAILLTGEIDRDLDVKAMEAGVVDFLEKDHLSAATLERSIRYAAGRGRTDRERVELLAAERSARKDAEAAQRSVTSILDTLESERTLFRQVLEQLPIGVVIADYPSGRMARGNAEVDRMLGRPFCESPTGEACGQWEGYHTDGRRYVDEDWPLTRTMRTGEPAVAEEVRIRRGDGSMGKIRLQSALVRSANGDEIAGVVTLEDVTARSDALDAIRFQAHLLDTVEQAVVATDSTGVVVYWNRHAEELYGWSGAEALGQSLSRLGLAEPFRRSSGEFLAQGALGDGHARDQLVRTKDGRSFHAHVAASSIRAHDGAVAGTVSISFDVTARRDAERASAQADAFFRAAFLGSAVPSCLTSTTGVVMTANRSMCELLGYDDGALAGVSVDSITHPDDRALGLQVRRELLTGARPSFRIEKRLLARDGSAIEVLVAAALVLETNDQPAYFTTQCFDISDRKRAEAAVRDREHQLAEIVAVQQELATSALENTELIRLLVERARSLTGAEAAMVVMVEDGRLVVKAAAGRAESLVGLPACDSSLTSRCLVERAALCCNDVAAASSVGAGCGLIGDARSLIAVPLLHEDMAVGAVTVFSRTPNAFSDRDVHTLQLIAGLGAAGLAHAAAFAAKQALVVERTAALATLGEREALIRSLIEKSADPLITLDEQGRISYASPALERLLGRPANDFLAVHPTALCHPEDRNLVADALVRMLATTQENVVVEARLGHRDGSWRTLRISGRNMLADPAVRGIIVNIHDMTDQAVTAVQLRQAQKLEAVGQLAGGVAHDFNNLLTVIAGHSEFLAQSIAPDDPRAADVDEIRLAAKRAASLTRQLLAFSRQQMLQPKIVDLNGIVSGLEPMLRRLIGEDISFVTRVASRPATVLADAGQLEQVLMNLAINGRDAMPDGGTLTIEIQHTALDEAYPLGHDGVVPGEYVMLAITDTGVGMSKEVREQIFDPFFTTKDAGQGTGLGLSTVYGIVKQSQGYIWAYSEPGLWSAFKVYLPLVREDVAETVAPSVVPAACGPETVLLVEDEAAVRGISRRILSNQGYHVLEACDGLHALEVAAEFAGTIDVLVTDVVMPRMNGRTLADTLGERIPGLAVLYLSGYTNDEILRRSPAEVRENQLLQKPFTSQALATAVREAISLRTASATRRKTG